MAKLLKLRRGTTSQHSSFTGAEGEVTVDTDKETLVVHNGSTAGGFPVMSAAGGTFTGNITATGNSIATSKFRGNDNVKVSLGDSEDLQIFHNGTDSLIQAHTTGNIENRARVNWIAKVNATDGGAEDAIKALQNGAIELYYDNSKKLETASNGVTITGNCWADAFYLGDNEKSYWGIGDDLQIYHNGTDSVIDNNTGALDIIAANNTKAIRVHNDATVDIGYQADNVQLRFGAGSDLVIYHSGTHSFIKDGGTGNLQMWTNQLSLLNSGGTESMIQAVENAQVMLYYDSVKKFETSTTGIRVIGDLLCDNATNAGKDLLWDESDDTLSFMDDVKAAFGSSDDLKIQHDGTDSYISNSTGNLQIRVAGSEKAIVAVPNGAVEVYHNNSKKLETTANGVRITGHSYQNDNEKIYLGSSDDLQIFHNGTDSIIDNNTGELKIETGIFNVRTDNGNENAIYSVYDAATKIYYNGSQKFETASYGIGVTGYVQMGLGGSTWGALANDNIKIGLGNDQDLSLWHSGTDSFIKGNTNSLYIDSADEIQLRNTSTEKYIRCVNNGSVYLYHNNSERVQTTSAGVTITGTLSPGTLASNTVGTSQLNASGSANSGTYLRGDMSWQAISVDSDKIEEGNSSVEVIDSGTGLVNCNVDGTQVWRTTSNGLKLGVSSDIGGEMFTLQRGGGRHAYFYNDNTNDNTVFTIRHQKARHGQWGKMFEFKDYNGNTRGTIQSNHTQTQYATSSDYRLKENIVDYAGADAWVKVKSLQPRKFEWKDDTDNTVVDGFIAHEAQAIIPWCVNGVKDATVTQAVIDDDTNQYVQSELNDIIPQQIDQSFMIPTLTSALKEAISKIETLETKVAALEAG